MKLSELPIIHFIRRVTLLATLVAIPGIAVCWNHLPKNIWNQAAPQTEPEFFPENDDESGKSVSIFNPETSFLALPEPIALPIVQAENIPVQFPSVQPHWAVPEASIQQVSWERSVHNFPSLEHRLITLGVTHRRIEQWGDRGELVRFSCTVIPSENFAYQKYFQAIGTDADTVMRSVIADIEKWKSGNYALLLSP